MSVDYVFPQSQTQQGGITLRQFYAGCALIGLLARGSGIAETRAWESADEMIKREGEKK